VATPLIKFSQEEGNLSQVLLAISADEWQMQFNVTNSGTSTLRWDVKELLHPIITDALSHAILTIFLIGISFSSKKLLNVLKILLAEQSVASKGNNFNNWVVNFIYRRYIFYKYTLL